MPSAARAKTFDAAEGEIVTFRCTGKSMVPIFLASFVVPSQCQELRLHRQQALLRTGAHIGQPVAAG